MEKGVDCTLFDNFSPAYCHTFSINRIKTEFRNPGIINNCQVIIPYLLSCFSLQDRVAFLDQITFTCMANCFVCKYTC